MSWAPVPPKLLPVTIRPSPGAMTSRPDTVALLGVKPRPSMVLSETWPVEPSDSCTPFWAMTGCGPEPWMSLSCR